MKRGRPNIRDRVQTTIIQTLSTYQTPLTVSSITRIISKELNQMISWNTTQKYLLELLQLDKVQTINLPHSKIDNKKGLTLYTLKK